MNPRAKGRLEFATMKIERAFYEYLNAGGEAAEMIEYLEHVATSNAGNDKEKLQRALRDNHEARQVLAGVFSTRSGKTFCYELPRFYKTGAVLRIRRVYREGERVDDISFLEITTSGTVSRFSFHSFAGQSEAELNEARVYLQDCAEVLSREFMEKVTADYRAKAGEFKSLGETERVLRSQLAKIENKGGAAWTS